MKTVAALTMAFDEADKLQIWVRHYARQVGAANCFIIDHGSTDSAFVDLARLLPAEAAALTVVRLPRVSIDEAVRAHAIGQFSAFLLQYYRWVIHTDVDELALADPRQYASIEQYCGSLTADHVTAIGLDVIHVADREAPLRTDERIGQQRAFARFSASMCKQALISGPTRWSKGFHTSDAATHFDRLYLLHLRFADVGLGVSRLRITQGVTWQTDGENDHQRVSADAFRDLIDRMAGLPIVDDPLTPDEGRLREYLHAVRSTERQADPDATFQIDLHIFGQELLRLPPPFRAAL